LTAHVIITALVVAIPSPTPPQPLPSATPPEIPTVYFAREVYAGKADADPKCALPYACYALGNDGVLRPFEVKPRRQR
jgi:hypothetical protein